MNLSNDVIINVLRDSQAWMTVRQVISKILVLIKNNSVLNHTKTPLNKLIYGKIQHLAKKNVVVERKKKDKTFIYRFKKKRKRETKKNIPNKKRKIKNPYDSENWPVFSLNKTNLKEAIRYNWWSTVNVTSYDASYILQNKSMFKELIEVLGYALSGEGNKKDFTTHLIHSSRIIIIEIASEHFNKEITSGISYTKNKR
jgi:hypothetical protein